MFSSYPVALLGCYATTVASRLVVRQNNETGVSFPLIDNYPNALIFGILHNIN
jgi:hypothetical protein